jgi:hypothetical protein
MVLLYGDSEEMIVLAVLKRAEENLRPSLVLPEKVLIRGNDTAFESQKLTLTTGESSISSGRMTLKGAIGSFAFSILSVRAGQLTRLVRNFLSRAHSHQAESEETMSLSAARIRLDAQETLNARADTMDLTAEGTARMDGKTVLLG